MNSTFFQTPRGDRCIITCHCGEGGCSHGQLELRLDRAADQPQFLVELWYRPADALWARLSQAWRVLLGGPIGCDLYWDSQSAHDVAGWLLAHTDAHGGC